MRLKKWCVPLLSLFLSTGIAEEIAEKEIVNSSQSVLDFKNFEEESEISFDVINKNETATEEWPEYMEWMCDLKKNIYALKFTINALSDGLSNERTQFFYLDPNLNEREIIFYLYKHKF